MNYCPGCGTKLDESAVSCQSCGIPLIKEEEGPIEMRESSLGRQGVVEAVIAAFILSGFRETWRLLRLFAVALAWGGPFIPLSFLNTNSGVATYPILARILAPAQERLFLLIPFFAITGVVVVAWLSRRARLSVASAPVLLAVTLTAAAYATSLFTSESPLPYFANALLFLFGLIGVPVLALLGALVTAASLWRRRWWAAVVWVAAWALITEFIWLGSSSTATDNLGGGLLAVISTGVLLITALVASALAFLVMGLISKRTTGSQTNGLT